MPKQGMLVEDFMTPDPITRPPQTPVDEAAAVMKEIGCRHLPILEKGKLVGIVSSKDVHRGGAMCADVMSRNPLTIQGKERIEVAAATMATRKVSALLVLEGGQIVGIVTTYDVLDAFAKTARGT